MRVTAWQGRSSVDWNDTGDPASLTAGQRQVQPSSMVAFAGGITAAGLEDRPGDCWCEWAPGWSGEPGNYQVDGFRLKFAHRWCPHWRHRAGMLT